jgi:predicted acyl esterase
MKLRAEMYLLMLVVCLAPVSARQGSDASRGNYLTERNVMVPMRDGVRLATDLYFPAHDGIRTAGRFPAIMERTPYNKDGAERSWASYYASRGYVCVAQDTRGRYNSEGIWHMMTDDVLDGYDTASWIVRQPWSDAKPWCQWRR